MPILCPHTARHVWEPKGNHCECRGGGGALADSSDFGLLWIKVHKNGRFPALDADELPCSAVNWPQLMTRSDSGGQRSRSQQAMAKASH